MTDMKALDQKALDKLILVGGRWHIARLLDYGHVGMGWGDPEDTSLICVAGDEERIAELPTVAEAVEPVAKLLDAYEAQVKLTPLGHENIQRGRSTYNWKMSVIAELRALAASPSLTGEE